MDTRRVVISPDLMIRRFALLSPIVIALGCGAAPPPSAAPPTQSVEPTLAAPTPPPTLGAAAPAATAAPAEPLGQMAKGADPARPSAVVRGAAQAMDAPLVSTITQAEVLAQVNKSGELFNKCYSLGAGASKTWRAKVTIKATVGSSGTVNSADVTTSTAKNPKVDACVVDAFKRLVFPRPKNSGTTTFTFPLSFDGMEQVQ